MIKLKNKSQLEGIRKSCRLLVELFDEIGAMIRPGISTGEIDAKAAEFIRKGGGVPAFLGYMGYPANICASVNEVVIHGIPNSRPLLEGDIVGIDIGIILDGFYSDRAYTYAVGKPSAEKLELMRVTQRCLDLAIEGARTGKRIKDISRAVFECADTAGFGVVRDYCGHGVGLDVHEEPQVPNYVGRGPNPRLKPGMVLAIEPMINLGTHEIEVLDDEWTVVTLDRRPSAHFEHTIAVLDDGIEVLTAPRA